LVARKVAARLKPNALMEFTRVMEREILPWLRKQEGFLDLIILSAPHCREVATISFWNDRSHAQAYSATSYPEALKILDKLLDGTPYVKTFDVVASTLHEGAISRPQEENLVRQRASSEAVN